MRLFMIIVRQSSQILKIREAWGRHTQLKTILPRCCVAGSLLVLIIMRQNNYCVLQVIVVSKDTTTYTYRCTCRRLPSGQSVYEFLFSARPRVSDLFPSIILTSDGINLVVCAANSPKHQNSVAITSSDETIAASATVDNVLFTVRQVNTGDIVAKAKPNYADYR